MINNNNSNNLNLVDSGGIGPGHEELKKIFENKIKLQKDELEKYQKEIFEKNQEIIKC